MAAMTLNANVENLLNERYWDGVYFSFMSPGTPRQIKVTLSTGAVSAVRSVA